ncbi:MAG: two-component system sensor histidine kinase NtrB [Desulfomonilaceae bacterium]
MTADGPFRLLKYFILSGFVVIVAVTVVLTGFLYTRSVDTLVKSAENYARLLAENLNYNIFVGFYSPLKARGVPMDLKKWDQFGALDSLIKDFTYGLKIQRIKIVDRQRKIIYSTEYDLIGKYEPEDSPVDEVFSGKSVTRVRQQSVIGSSWQSSVLADTFYPLREWTGNYWMLGVIYGVIEITQDVTDQYRVVQRSIVVIMLVAVGLMVFLFVMLTLIVRRGERILLERAKRQKMLEEQLQQSEKLASIGQMVAILAHEIRNPLGIIKSSAEVLAKKENPDQSRLKKLSGVIVEEATRLSNVLSDFLEFARPKLPQLRPTSMYELIDRVKRNLDEELRARDITWTIEDNDGRELIFQGDPDLLYQAFLNIAMNAFAAMDNGGAIKVSMGADAENIWVDFLDSGKGIKEEHLGKIFTPFFTTHQMGTGLGLSVVHNIVTAHGGRLEVESEYGHWTKFRVILPRNGTSTPLEEQRVTA